MRLACSAAPASLPTDQILGRARRLGGSVSTGGEPLSVWSSLSNGYGKATLLSWSFGGNHQMRSFGEDASRQPPPYSLNRPGLKCMELNPCSYLLPGTSLTLLVVTRAIGH